MKNYGYFPADGLVGDEGRKHRDGGPEDAEEQAMTWAMTQAEDEWNAMSVREKVAAIDPEGERELLLDCHKYASTKIPMTHHDAWGLTAQGIEAFLDIVHGQGWREARMNELLDGDADGAYEESVDA